MDLVFKDAFILRNILKIIKDDFGDMVLVFNSDGVSSNTMDSSHISLVHFHLNVDEAFTKYEYTYSSPSLRVGFSTANFLKVMNLADKDASVGLKIDASNLDVMVFTIKSDNNVMQFDLRLMDIDMDELEIPTPGEHFTLTFPTSVVSPLIKKINGDAIELCVSPEDPSSLMYTTSGQIGTLFGKLTNGIPNGTPRCAASKLKLSMKYMKTFCCDLCDYVSFNFEPENPLRIDYKICASFIVKDGLITRVMKDKSCLVFYLAPKIDA